MDLNNDGIKDILSGSYSRDGETEDMAGLFQVLWGQAGGTYKAPEPLKGSDGKILIITEAQYVARICTRPTAVDWDGDGDLDLIVGNFGGQFHLFRGEGPGKFAPQSTKIMAGAKPAQVPQHGDPAVVDWDGDGDLDIVSGSGQGGVFVSENSAGPGKEPVLAPFKNLIPATRAKWTDLSIGDNSITEPGRDTRVWVVDYNGDGKLDLLVGDTSTVVHPVGGLTADQVRARHGTWVKQMEELNAKLEKVPEAQADLAERLGKEMETLREAQEQFMKQESTGFVWLYLRK